jgi:hypothetical protein
MKEIVIATFLNEVEGAQEKYVVREVDDSGRVLRTRVVGSEYDAETVKLEWQKQS